MVLFFTCSSLGCIGVGAHLLYWMKGTRIDPEYEGLEGKRVAIVVMSDSAPYGPDVTTQILSKRIRRELVTNIKKIELVSRSEIESWTDTNNWDQNYDYKGKKTDRPLFDILLQRKVQCLICSHFKNNTKIIFP